MFCKRPRSMPWHGSTASRCPRRCLAGWHGHGPELRSQILDALLGREKWSEILLTAIDRKQIPASDIDATRRQRLQRSGNERIKSMATRLLAGTIDSNRREVVEAHASVLSMHGRRAGRRSRVRQAVRGLPSTARRRSRSRPKPGFADRLFTAGAADGHARSEPGGRVKVSRLHRDH